MSRRRATFARAAGEGAPERGWLEDRQLPYVLAVKATQPLPPVVHTLVILLVGALVLTKLTVYVFVPLVQAATAGRDQAPRGLPAAGVPARRLSLPAEPDEDIGLHL